MRQDQTSMGQGHSAEQDEAAVSESVYLTLLFSSEEETWMVHISVLVNFSRIGQSQ